MELTDPAYPLRLPLPGMATPFPRGVNVADGRFLAHPQGAPPRSHCCVPILVKGGILATDYAGADGSGGAVLDVSNRESLTDGAVTSALLSDSFSCGNGFGCNGSIVPVGADQILLLDGANMDIGINAVFSQSPRDSAGFEIRLEIIPVPVPAADWLFGFCLIAVARIARRLKTVQ